MKNYFTRQNIFSFLTIGALIVNVSISGISNSSAISFMIKLVSSTLLLSILYTHVRLSGDSFKSFITSNAAKRILLLSAGIISYLIITLFYSSNPDYGAQKIFNIIASVIPNIIVLHYLINFSDKKPYKEYFIFIIVISFFITLTAILILKPFDQSTIYQFAPQRWSHVFAGRIISFLTLIVFIFLINAKDLNKILFYSFIFIIGFYITYLTGLRSALIGLVIFSIISFGWNFFKKNITSLHLYSAAAIAVIISALIFFTAKESSTQQRFSNLVMIENFDFGGDQPILTRIESYKISWQMFIDSPVLGKGFGSFKGINGIQWTSMQKYPHNIILEILSELGIVGLLMFSGLFFVIIRSIYNVQFTMFNGQSEVKSQKSKVKNDFTSVLISDSQYTTNHNLRLTTHFLLLAFLFWLFLAMFSKDISTQGFLWIFAAFYGAKHKK